MKTALTYKGTVEFDVTIVIDNAPQGFDLINDIPDTIDTPEDVIKYLESKGVNCHLLNDIDDEISDGYQFYEGDDIVKIDENTGRNERIVD